MTRSSTMRSCRAALLAVLLSAFLPASAWPWGGDAHHYIALHYSRHLPSEIDGLRSLDRVVDQHVTDPDTRKPSTPGEGFRHYIDIDWYPDFLDGTLPHDRDVLERAYGPSTVLTNGVLPWAIAEVTANLSRQFQAARWDSAALTLADLCHYVGDASQPLHCTQNYDGQLTGNYGIHSRYESALLSQHLGELHTDSSAVSAYANTVDAMFGFITASWDGVAPILQADGVARAASGGAYDGAYYDALWAGVGALTRERIHAATVMTASLVYSAWLSAGRPEVPGSSGGPGLPSAARLDAGPSPFRDALTIGFAGAGPLRVEVFDVRGACVARLAEGASGAPGPVSWRPRGAAAAPGLYFVRLTGPGLTLVRRAIFAP